ncbi:hypothetical protein UO65_2200 [Actinokineospora spheciospongiae]|uniref:Uncharacterized protein n=1 Tax=Actinokineospora spheciospongiae TaxID=909613 RepID=W7IQ45_9PSEU|nr:hypothetical protein [Actinokineospora spheciospongiae]EWC62513.1 hypothetical protein UO65_2200 [Actinokineospora spheciospongiae]PWW63015.1 hypothetical protein DFQ13_1045 [Actinokineospora spheciospongiae]
MTRQLDRIPFPGSPSPGLDLRLAVASALTALTPPVAAPTLVDVADALLGALARTAATGDTCLVLPAAEAVADARAFLRGGDPRSATTALVRARDHLDRRL